MNSRQAVIILTTVFLITLPFLTPVLRGDGVGYYAYLRSFAVDSDFDFTNEYLRADKLFLLNLLDANGHIKTTELTKKGLPRNQYPVGCSLLWTPFFIVGHIVSGLRKVSQDGYSHPYIYALGFGTALYAFIGFIFIYKLCRNYFNALVTLIVILSLWFASNLPIYMYFLTFMSHSLSLFIGSFFIYFWHKTLFKKGVKEWIVLGGLGGLMAIVYYVNSIFLLLPLLEYLSIAGDNIRRRSSKGLLHNAGFGLLFILSLSVFMLLNFFILNAIYGSYSANDYVGGTIINWKWLKPRFIEVLFSGRHALFSWNPVYLIAVLGYLFFYKRDRRIFFYFGICLLVFLCIISVSEVDTTDHSSFGSRTFISCLPIFAIGLCSFIEYLRKKIKLIWIIVVAVLLIIWNVGFMFQWGTNMLSNRFPISWEKMIYNQIFVIPQRIPPYMANFFISRSGFVSRIQQENADVYLKEIAGK